MTFGRLAAGCQDAVESHRLGQGSPDGVLPDDGTFHDIGMVPQPPVGGRVREFAPFFGNGRQPDFGSCHAPMMTVSGANGRHFSHEDFVILARSGGAPALRFERTRPGSCRARRLVHNRSKISLQSVRNRSTESREAIHKCTCRCGRPLGVQNSARWVYESRCSEARHGWSPQRGVGGRDRVPKTGGGERGGQRRQARPGTSKAGRPGGCGSSGLATAAAHPTIFVRHGHPGPHDLAPGHPKMPT